MEYKIITWSNKIKMVMLVTESMNEGWKPQGGVEITMPDGFPMYSQAMVMHDNEKDTSASTAHHEPLVMTGSRDPSDLEWLLKNYSVSISLNGKFIEWNDYRSLYCLSKEGDIMSAGLVPHLDKAVEWLLKE